MPISWTCDPPEFAAYGSHITAVDAGDSVTVRIIDLYDLADSIDEEVAAAQRLERAQSAAQEKT